MPDSAEHGSGKKGFDLTRLFAEAAAQTAIAAEKEQKSHPAPFSAYVHIPFCRVRCGYCDFNTYTKDFGPGASRSSYADSVITEIHLANRFLSAQGVVPPQELSSVYFGGGTPTLLAGEELARILAALRDTWPMTPGAEISIEANPDTVSPQLLDTLCAAGFTRVSLGMQSADPQILRHLDRTHDPDRIPQVVQWIRERDLQVSLDLIYGTPGETLAQWQKSLESALALPITHLSAYSLVIEPGTKMGRAVRHGEIAPIDPDEQADKYLLADRLLQEAGFCWYEISNWAKPTATEAKALRLDQLNATELSHASTHNLAYWKNWNWWGFGPGAHSHWAGHRFWNRKHPLAYAQALQAGELPVQSGETVSLAQAELERIMLGLRTAAGVVIDNPKFQQKLPGLVRQGLLQAGPAKQHRAVLTLRGRLLADLVTCRLTE